MVKVIFLHPDLGIGGAERLIVDAALALKRCKHNVVLYTSHHDTTHCFPETVDGSLKVNCVGDWLPRSIGGYLMALCVYVRMIYLALYISWFMKVDYDVAIVDQVSACIPFLYRCKNRKVLFYCHYPDQLLTQRKSLMKKVYRYFIDWLEEYTTGCADLVLVNSQFTASVFKKTFTSITSNPAVLYPSLDFSKFDACLDVALSEFGLKDDYETLFLSVNRFERKKNLPLALYALEHLIYGELERKEKVKSNQGKSEASELTQSAKERTLKVDSSKIHLVLAGGYDTCNLENIQHYNELLKLCTKLKLDSYVTFLKSPSETCKVNLLRKATSLIYTPDCEHFGIVPIEAMYCSTPVVAVNSGGPKETVLHASTGFLCRQSSKHFAEAMQSFVDDKTLKTVMGRAGHQRVIQKFSFDQFSQSLNTIVAHLAEKKQR
uniref:Alpha-1,3/1,6-mannosyltransferase ALG2 n=1 Tax=Hirondellea gigas TaxID=1518452 RepID=A0A2P2I8R2_9CRUS